MVRESQPSYERSKCRICKAMTTDELPPTSPLMRFVSVEANQLRWRREPGQRSASGIVVAIHAEGSHSVAEGLVRRKKKSRFARLARALPGRAKKGGADENLDYQEVVHVFL